MAHTDDTKTQPQPPVSPEAGTPPAGNPAAKPPLPPEIGGPTGPEPTRFGDWERKGRVSDF
ncbi:succinate dehydrogenase assembly factor 4 [Roseomonas sp. WA12]